MAKKIDKELHAKFTRIIERAKVGRPPDYDETIHPYALLTLFSEGKDIEAFCFFAEIHRATFYLWLNEYPLFEEMYVHAKELAKLWWTEKAQIGLIRSS